MIICAFTIILPTLVFIIYFFLARWCDIFTYVIRCKIKFFFLGLSALYIRENIMNVVYICFHILKSVH